MHKVRIAPTLLYKNNLVKGKNFESWRVVGNLYQMIKLYNLREVDELIFFDIEASKNNIIQLSLIDEFADECFVPLTIGGGIKTLEDIDNLLRVGADKVCINTNAVKDINFVTNFGRDIEYYTGIVFEVFSGTKEIASGGRYDDLLKSLGAKKSIPAVGAAINLKNI